MSALAHSRSPTAAPLTIPAQVPTITAGLVGVPGTPPIWTEGGGIVPRTQDALEKLEKVRTRHVSHDVLAHVLPPSLSHFPSLPSIVATHAH